MKNNILIILFIGFLPLTIFSKEKFYFGLYVDGGINLHSANFKGFSGTNSCCDYFHGGNSITPAFGVNIGKNYEISKMSFIDGIEAKIQFANYSADFTETYKYANINYPTKTIPGYSEYFLSNKLNYIQLNLDLKSKLFGISDLELTYGPSIAFNISNSYSQYEKMLTPDDKVWLENNSKIRNQATGEIPNVTSLLFGLNLGISYQIKVADNFTLHPKFTGIYYANNLVSDLNWKLYSVRLGVDFNYHLMQNKPPALNPPIEDILPLPVSPKIPEIPSISFEITFNAKAIHNNDTLEMDITQNDYFQNIAYLPILFFDKNQFELKNSETGISESFEKSAQTELLNFLAEYLYNNPEVKINISANQNEHESPKTAENRINYIKTSLNKKGVSDSRISKSKIINNQTAGLRDELKEENQSIEISFSNNMELIPLRLRQQSQLDFKEQTINIIKKVINPQNILNENSALFINSIDKKTLVNNNEKYEITQSNINQFLNRINNRISVNSEYSYGDGLQKDTTLYFNLKVNKKLNTIENLVIEDGKNLEQYYLGYCRFNKPEIEYLDSMSLIQVKAELAKGSSFEIISLTDNAGTKERNIELSTDRSKYAAKLIGIPENKYQIKLPAKYQFSNDHPYGRMLNRSVIIRVLK